MRIADFDYELPERLIAQRPADRRDASRLLVCRQAPPEGLELEHRAFSDLPELLRPDDVLVLNDARVIPARLWARRASGGRVELLFLGPAADGCWRALARPARRVRIGERLAAAEATLEVVEAASGGERVLRRVDSAESFAELLERHGRMPLPPYIRRSTDDDLEPLDRERYQTVYARAPGAVAAPTAGLHFTPALLDRLRERGVTIETVTLHVGAGTFRPVTAERVEDHRMEGERYAIEAATAERLTAARATGRRIVAVGTTVVRSLEHAWDGERVLAGERTAELFISPGYRFGVVGGMLTNFHLPRSTPVLLVAALLGREPLLDAYRVAVEQGYRFYSYGDAMLLLPSSS